MAGQPFLALITPLTGDAVGGGQPPGIWGPTDPRPTNPIAGVPGLPGYQPPTQPPVIWGPPGPWPTPPIVLPPDEAPPDQPPPTGPAGKLEWHTVWTEEYGWAMVGVQTDPHVTPSKKK